MPAKKSAKTDPAKPDAVDALRECLRAFGMTAAAESLDEILRTATEEGCSYADFLDYVLQQEIDTRWGRKVTRLLRQARLGALKSLEEFDFSARPKLKEAAVKQLTDCAFVEEGRPVICIGRPGTGKTHVAKALAHAACLKGYSVRTGITIDILDELEASLVDNTYAKVFRRYSQADLLLLDEVGYLSLDDERCSHLFRLIAARHPHRATIVTSNTAFTNWGRFFPSEAQAMATIDRLLDQATVLRFTGKSFREPREILGEEVGDI